MENNRHLIAIDLDGTLLTDKKDITPFTKKVLQRAVDQGHIVVIATGRSDIMSLYYYHDLQLNTPMINYNGAYIHHPRKTSWSLLTRHSVPKKTALEIVEVCYELDSRNIWIESGNQIILDRHDPEIIAAFEMLHRANTKLPLEIGQVRKHIKEDPTSLIIYPHEEKITDLQKHLTKEFSDFVDHRIWGSQWSLMEVSKKGLSKAYGIDKLADYYNIPRERIIAFGDEDNDLEMIDYAGVGVAMENGIEELKAIADHITLTNEENGVGTFLAEYLNIKVTVG